MTTPNGDTTTPPLTTATPLIEEGLVRDEQTNEVYLPLTSTVVLKRKQEMLYVPLDFENNLTVDALVDSGAFVSAIAQDDSHTIKQKAPKNILEIDDPPNLKIQVANGQLEKPLLTATLEFEIGDNNNEEINRANNWVALYEEKHCSHWHDTRPHTFFALDKAG